MNSIVTYNKEDDKSYNRLLLTKGYHHQLCLSFFLNTTLLLLNEIAFDK